MIAPRRRISVLVPNPELARQLPRLRCVQRAGLPIEDPTDLSTHVFIVVSLLELPAVASFAREANDRHYLKGLFVRDDSRSNLLPQILNKANLRAVKNLVVYTDATVPGRVLKAYCIGAEEALIADVRLIQDRLFLISCGGETFELAMDRHPALKRMPNPERRRFSLAPDGAFVHWPDSDVHLDLEEVRIILDPVERERARARRLMEASGLGRALAAYRRRNGLRQSDIPGLSERQIRRYEHGARIPLSSLALLARAHGLEVSAFLDQVVEEGT